MNKFLILLVTAILCVSVVGCKKEKEATGEKDASAIEPPKPIVYYAPLTGEVVKEEVSERAVAVMINNHTKARPQSGISQADMIYEILQGGWPFSKAIFPIKSARFEVLVNIILKLRQVITLIIFVMGKVQRHKLY